MEEQSSLRNWSPPRTKDDGLQWVEELSAKLGKKKNVSDAITAEEAAEILFQKSRQTPAALWLLSYWERGEQRAQKSALLCCLSEKMIQVAEVNRRRSGSQ